MRTTTPKFQPRLKADAAAFFWAKMRLLRIYQFRDRDSVFYHGVSATQCYVLATIIRAGALTPQALCAELSFDKSTATRVLDGLDRAGLIKREPNPDDGRSVVLRATRAGRRVHDAIAADMIAQDAELLAGFPPAVRRGMIQVMKALAEGAAQQMGRTRDQFRGMARAEYGAERSHG